MTVKTNILLRIYLIGIICLLFGVAVLGKVYHIQNYNHKYWKNLADSLSTKIFDVEAERGNIYSADGELLATTVPYFDVYVDFGSNAMTDELFKANIDSLAYYFSKTKKDKSEQQYKKELTNARKLGKRYYPIFKNIDFVQLNKVKTWPLFREGKYKGGLIIETNQPRYKPFGFLADRTIGYVKKDGKRVGIEAKYNKELSGENGKMLKQKIAGGTWMPIRKTGYIEPKNGKNIHTTIDIKIQDIASSTLLEALQTYNAEFGCAVVMEVKTGAIKAIANLGKNKSNQFIERYNYAVGDRFEPGSVFKLAGYLALFDDEYITLKDSINTNYAVANFGVLRLTDDNHNTQYKYLTPEKAMAVSSNVAIAKWVTKFYNDDRKKYYSKLAQFGLTTKTNIEIQGEQEPLIKLPENWSYYSLPWMAHGYEVKLSALQILAFYNAVANDGYRIQPYLVEKITQNGKSEYINNKHEKVKICSKQAAESATEILKAVINDVNGTGHRIYTPHFEIAGKSGTAKMSFGTKGYTDKNLSTFVGFFPANNPLYSCIVMIGEPKGEITSGGYISAPVFRIIADKIITSNIKNNQAINKDTLLVKQNPPKFITATNTIDDILKIYDIKYKNNSQLNYDYAYVNIDNINKKVNIQHINANTKKVPNVKNMLLDDAIYILENAGLKVGFSGKGKVKTQSIQEGTDIIKGTYIHLNLF
ncbi:MAG: transpeptidase family protein [Sphingobacteriales bacterium]|nr:MAG: transpeptidase family protein [Sphingobacteriales bacterium]